MISSAVIDRYANALADVVLSPQSDVKQQDAVAQLRTFCDVFGESRDLRAVLATPAVPATRKRAVLKDIAQRLGASRVVRNFILVLSDHRRITALAQVVDAVETVFDERMGFVRAEVKCAYDLPAAQQNELSSQLSALAGKQIRMRFSVDPELIGGVTAKIGSRVYDGSVKGQLADMRRRLSASVNV